MAVGVPGALLALDHLLANVETPRFREPIDPFFVLLAACAVATAARRVLVLLGLGGAPVRGRGRASELAGHDTELVQMVKRLA